VSQADPGPPCTPGLRRHPRELTGECHVHERRPRDDSGEDQLNNTINTTPLVDVMLVLLIIFLITIPVVTQTIKLELPKETQPPAQTKPENIVLAVNRDGEVFWGTERMPDNEALVNRLKIEAVKEPQPEVHIRGDSEVRYESVGRVVVACQRAGIFKVGFITEPPAGAGTRLK
jgi:biopolymer transport protein ExbD